FIGVLTSCGGENKTNEEALSGEEHVAIEGINFPTTLSNDTTKLVLNGGGVRTFLFIKIYVCGLYLPAKNHDAKSIMEADEPSTIRLHVVSRAFTSERMADVVRTQFEKSNPGRTAEFKTRIDMLCNRLAGEVIQKGDECDIQYTPNEGIRFFKNGKDINMLLSGLDFKQALWGNWLSNNPADEEMKKGMLGL